MNKWWLINHFEKSNWVIYETKGNLTTIRHAIIRENLNKKLISFFLLENKWYYHQWLSAKGTLYDNIKTTTNLNLKTKCYTKSFKLDKITIQVVLRKTNDGDVTKYIQNLFVSQQTYWYLNRKRQDQTRLLM